MTNRANPSTAHETTELPSVHLMGVDYSRVTLDEAVSVIMRWVRSGASGKFVAATGFHGLLVAQQDPSFREVLNAADLFCADSITPVLLSRIVGDPLPGRVPGPDLFTSVLAEGDDRGCASFFLGDTDETLRQLRERVKDRYPGHRIAGMCSPPFRPLTSEEEQEIIDQINDSGADILWVALGTPKQDRWIHRNRSKLEVSVAVAVGAAFRFAAGTTKRAPKWIRSCGLEWAWRLVREPSRVWRRTLIGGPRFCLAALKWLLLERRREQGEASAG